MHSMEQQETNKEDKTNAGNYHSTQQEAVAAFSLNNLQMRQQNLTPEHKSCISTGLVFFLRN